MQHTPATFQPPRAQGQRSGFGLSLLVEESMNNREGIDHWSDTKKFFDDGCPFCGSKEFLEGPHGGQSINFKCARCGATFNDMGPFGVDLLARPEVKHTRDTDCTLNDQDTCTVCGVYHGDPCEFCGQRGYHMSNCPGPKLEEEKFDGGQG